MEIKSILGDKVLIESNFIVGITQKNRHYKIIDTNTLDFMTPYITDYGVFYKTNYSGLMVSKKGECLKSDDHHKKMKLSLPSYDKDGYKRVSVIINGKVITKKVHRIIAETFLSDYSESKQINHKDYDRGNNNLDNLELVSVRDNNIHRCKRIKTTSKYSGVHFDRKEQKYKSNIMISKVNYNLYASKCEMKCAYKYNMAKKAIDEGSRFEYKKNKEILVYGN